MELRDSEFWWMRSWSILDPKSREFKRFAELYLDRDWDWVSSGNYRLFPPYRSRRRPSIDSSLFRTDEEGYWIRRFPNGWDLIPGYHTSRNNLFIYPDLWEIRGTFIWISIVVESFGIQEEISQGIFEIIGSYL